MLGDWKAQLGLAISVNLLDLTDSISATVGETC